MIQRMNIKVVTWVTIVHEIKEGGDDTADEYKSGNIVDDIA